MLLPLYENIFGYHPRRRHRSVPHVKLKIYKVPSNSVIFSQAFFVASLRSSLSPTNSYFIYSLTNSASLFFSVRQSGRRHACVLSPWFEGSAVLVLIFHESVSRLPMSRSTTWLTTQLRPQGLLPRQERMTPSFVPLLLEVIAIDPPLTPVTHFPSLIWSESPNNSGNDLQLQIADLFSPQYNNTVSIHSNYWLEPSLEVT